ncbi:DUF4116-containing protein [Aureococcus anophagefferens]|nr:DUF4116-containing protein [Aureococcus anophagefferens]
MDIYKKQMDVNFFGYVRVVQAMMPHAFVRSFRVEMQLTEKPIDACIISPGFVKPTMLVENGLKLNDQMWAACKARLGTDQAKDEYGPLLDTFIKYSPRGEGHPRAGRPLHGYKVGPDSRATPVAGLLPVPLQDFVMKAQVYGRQGKL